MVAIAGANGLVGQHLVEAVQASGDRVIAQVRQPSAHHFPSAVEVRKAMKIPGLRHSAEEVGGLVFFGRTLDKIRLHSQGKLPADYNRGTGFDGRVCRFLSVEHPSLVERVLEGGSDEEILEWCFVRGRRPSEEEIFIFNSFLRKRGWHDDSSVELEMRKANEALLTERTFRHFSISTRQTRRQNDALTAPPGANLASQQSF